MIDDRTVKYILLNNGDKIEGEDVSRINSKWYQDMGDCYYISLKNGCYIEVINPHAVYYNPKGSR